jgi:hypothetical protein
MKFIVVRVISVGFMAVCVACPSEMLVNFCYTAKCHILQTVVFVVVSTVKFYMQHLIFTSQHAFARKTVQVPDIFGTD